MKLYGISGLGADERVFSFLELQFPIETISWISPLKNESISSYSLRLSERIDDSQPFCLIAVSFGGLVAVEINKVITPVHTFLISTILTKEELPLLYSIVGKSRLPKILPAFLFRPPLWFANFVFGAENKVLLGQIINDTDTYFAKWAVGALCTWQDTDLIDNFTLIQGEKDYLFSTSKREGVILIKEGHHFMIVDKSDEIEKIIKQQLDRFVEC